MIAIGRIRRTAAGCSHRPLLALTLCLALGAPAQAAATGGTLDAGVCKKARLAAGAVAPTPRRLTAVEQLLEGERITPELMLEASELGKQSISPIDDIRTSADYRRRITGVYIRRALEELCA